MLSAAIICKNEENNITACLESIKWIDDIIVIDAESTDNTLEHAKKYTDKIFIRKWDGYKNQREYALSKVSHEWVFVLDADERCSPELKEEILSVIQNSNNINGFKIQRKSYFLNKRIKYSGWNPDYKLRLFKLEYTSITERLVHEGYIVDGKIEYLKHHIDHYTVSSISDFAEKINKYSSLQAIEKSNRKKVGIGDLILRPISAFIRIFIFKQGFRDGIHGLMVTYFDIITNILTYMKILEIQKKRENNENL